MDLYFLIFKLVLQKKTKLKLSDIIDTDKTAALYTTTES